MIKATKIFLGIYLFIIFAIVLVLYSPFYLIFGLLKLVSIIANYMMELRRNFTKNKNAETEFLNRQFENQNRTNNWIQVTENDFDNMSEEEF